MNLIYRIATPSDLDGLKELGLLAFGQHRMAIGEAGWQKMQHSLSSEQLYVELLAISKGFVCVHEGRLVGMAYLIPKGNPTELFDEDWCYMRMVGVHPEYGGRGIGRTLITGCIDHARANGEQVMALHTSEFMNSARHIYESIGFTKLKEIEARFGKRYWVYTMEL